MRHDWGDPRWLPNVVCPHPQPLSQDDREIAVEIDYDILGRPCIQLGEGEEFFAEVVLGTEAMGLKDEGIEWLVEFVSQAYSHSLELL